MQSKQIEVQKVEFSHNVVGISHNLVVTLQFTSSKLVPRYYSSRLLVVTLAYDI